MIEHLFVKKNETPMSMSEVSSISATEMGLVGGIEMLPLRQILILSTSTIREFEIEPGALKENVIINPDFDLYSLPSGTVISLGSIKVRLTFHCEPCAKIKDVVSLKKIMFKRGYLGCVVSSGSMKVGDKVQVLGKFYEEIPYKLPDRIKWFLDNRSDAVPVTELVRAIGLSNSYCRTIPNMLKRRPDIDSSKIIYKKSNSESPKQKQMELQI